MDFPKVFLLHLSDLLNYISLKYFKPLIDVGYNVITDKRFEATAHAQLVTCEIPCLWCTGQIDGKMFGDEFFTESQKKAKTELECYRSNRPSIISSTTLAACLAMDKLLLLLRLYGKDHESVSYVDITNEFCQHHAPEIKTRCVCKEFRV